MKKILLTGCAGYIGSVLLHHLLDTGYEVYGLDSMMFGDQGIQHLKKNPQFHFYPGDITKHDSYSKILPMIDGIIHLAGISGMPSCDKYPELAKNVNFEATKNLFETSKKFSNIKRFVLASTTSIYGATKTGETVDETTPPKPLSLYAETKLQCEEYLLKTPRPKDLTTVVLRFPTAFGLSPRMRFDLTVNEFTRDLTLGRELKIYGEGFWRPYCHVIDLSRACIFALTTDPQKVDGEILCVGGQFQNYTKMMIYELLKKLIPEGKITMVPSIVDPRDYKVSFGKIENLGFKITKNVEDGIKEIHQALQNNQFNNPMDSVFSSILP